MSGAPIGVFDSGVGGLSVLSALRRELPGEDVLYLADSAHNPYGARAPADVERLTLRGARWLVGEGCKLVVIACNTACAFSLSAVRADLGGALPVVGLVPALKPAVAATRSGVVGVLATPVTLGGSLLSDVVARFAAPAGVRVLPLQHPDLVPLVEAGRQDAPETRAALRALLDPALEAGMDALVLGCTHYPFLAGSLRALYGGRLALFDSGGGVARQTRRVLEGRGLLGVAGPLGAEGQGALRLHTTGSGAQREMLERMAGGLVMPGVDRGPWTVGRAEGA